MLSETHVVQVYKSRIIITDVIKWKLGSSTTESDEKRTHGLPHSIKFVFRKYCRIVKIVVISTFATAGGEMSEKPKEIQKYYNF